MLMLAGLPGCASDQVTSEESSCSPVGQGFLSALKQAGWVVKDLQGQVIASDQIEVQRVWQGTRCRTTVKNIGKSTLRRASVILFDLEQHGLPADSPVYGEGFQMLYQNGGTLGQREAIGNNSPRAQPA